MFAAAPERTYSLTNTVALVLPSTLYLASGAPAVTPALALDFGDGQGYRAATWDQPLSTTYATAGTKRVKVKLVYTYRDNQAGQTNATTPGTTRIVRPPTYLTDTRESWFDLRVFAVAGPAARYADPKQNPAAGFDHVVTATAIPVFGTVYYPPNATFTDHLGGTANVRFGQGHTRITKPFIVVEGYNTSRIAPHLVGEGNKPNDIKTFLESIFVRFSNNAFFDDAIEQAGYDLIYIDFTEGTDYIQRNAALFEEVLRWVNNEKQAGGSTEPNVVMGESMGGLVARYGLARLVRNGYDPQTRLLVLHDSPQRGAYNPMGVQALTLQTDFPLLPNIRTRDLNDKLNEGLNILDAPATKQLSLFNVTGIDDEYEANTFIDGAYKDMTYFAGGAPSTFPTIVATSDGSQCGRPQSTPPHQELTRNTGEYLLNPFIVSIGFKSDAVVNALPSYGTQDRLAHLRAYFTIAILWSHLDIPILSRNYESPANMLPYETLPGGYTNPADQQSLVGGFVFPHFFNFTFLYNGPLCFVPTYSALDVPTVTTTTAYAKYINNATNNPSKPSVLHYLAQESVNGNGTQFNLPHLRFTARNSEWLFNEMQQVANTRGCDTECAISDGQPITGPVTICGTSTFTSPLQGPNYTYTWTTIPPNLFTVASGTGPTFQTSNAANGGAVIQLAISSGGCAPTTLFKDVAVGVSGSPATAGPDWGNDCGRINRLCRIDNFDPLATYAISVTGALNLVGLGVTSTGTYTVASGPNGGQPGYIEITATNGCGTSDVSALEVYTPCGDPGRPAAPTATLYPNPARETVDVHVENASAAHPVTVRLFDGYGRPRAEQTSTGAASVRLATDKLPAGLYFVHVLRGREVLSRQQLRIEK